MIEKVYICDMKRCYNWSYLKLCYTCSYPTCFCTLDKEYEEKYPSKDILERYKEEWGEEYESK